MLEPRDIGETVYAANRIGDEKLKHYNGRVPQPHIFSHGISAQPQAWFAHGYETCGVKECNTFTAGSL